MMGMSMFLRLICVEHSRPPMMGISMSDSIGSQQIVSQGWLTPNPPINMQSIGVLPSTTRSSASCPLFATATEHPAFVSCRWSNCWLMTLSSVRRMRSFRPCVEAFGFTLELGPWEVEEAPSDEGTSGKHKSSGGQALSSARTKKVKVEPNPGLDFSMISPVKSMLNWSVVE